MRANLQLQACGTLVPTSAATFFQSSSPAFSAWYISTPCRSRASSSSDSSRAAMARSRFRRAFTRSPSAVRSSWLDMRTAAASTRRSSSAVFVAASSVVGSSAYVEIVEYAVQF